ncbi:MAG: flagellar basal body protein [Hyphomicrobiales bacterium]|nr:flagellar basal body protein [Hyphomicrobiales bacterium]
MQPVSIFKLTSEHARWLSQRQGVIAENVANANTPGYKASDLSPFEAAAANAQLRLAATQPGHLRPSGHAAREAETAATGGPQSETGNTVDLQSEMLKLGETGSAFALNRAAAKAFHRLALASMRG